MRECWPDHNRTGISFDQLTPCHCCSYPTPRASASQTKLDLLLPRVFPVKIFPMRDDRFSNLLARGRRFSRPVSVLYVCCQTWRLRRASSVRHMASRWMKMRRHRMSSSVSSSASCRAIVRSLTGERCMMAAEVADGGRRVGGPARGRCGGLLFIAPSACAFISVQRFGGLSSSLWKRSWRATKRPVQYADPWASITKRGLVGGGDGAGWSSGCGLVFCFLEAIDVTDDARELALTLRLVLELLRLAREMEWVMFDKTLKVRDFESLGRKLSCVHDVDGVMFSFWPSALSGKMVITVVFLREAVDCGQFNVDDRVPGKMLPLCRTGPIGSLIKGRFLTAVFCPRQGVNARGMLGLGSLEVVVPPSMT